MQVEPGENGKIVIQRESIGIFKRKCEVSLQEPINKKTKTSNTFYIQNEIQILLESAQELIENARIFPLESCQKEELKLLDLKEIKVKYSGVSKVKLEKSLVINREQLVNVEYSNSTEDVIKLIIENHIFLIPPKSLFIASDFKFMPKAAKKWKAFDFILMDPPWENASAKRYY
jgi:hypothetical protein